MFVKSESFENFFPRQLATRQLVTWRYLRSGPRNARGPWHPGTSPVEWPKLRYKTWGCFGKDGVCTEKMEKGKSFEATAKTCPSGTTLGRMFPNCWLRYSCEKMTTWPESQSFTPKGLPKKLRNWLLAVEETGYLRPISSVWVSLNLVVIREPSAGTPLV